jgi:3-dehydroquinate synthetase
MVVAGALAVELGMVDAAFDARQRKIFADYGLPVSWAQLPADEVIEAMGKDKKVRAGTMKFIVSDRIGHVVQRTDITEAQVRAALAAVSR